MYDVKRLLRIVDPEAVVEVSTAADGVSDDVVVSNYKDFEFVNQVLEGAGFHQVNKETAAEGTVEFTNVSLFSEETETADANGEPHESGENDDEQTGQTRSLVKVFELGGADNVPIDGDGRSFTVLVDADTHKLANKIFSEVLGNEDDKSQYGAFLYDFDNFLAHYQNPNPPVDEDEETDEDTQAELPIGKTADAAADEGEDDETDDNPKVKEIASLLFNTDAEVFFSNFGKYMPETAGSSPVFKIILGLLVQVAVTAVGKALLDAWDRKDKGLFERLLFKLVKIITKDYFPSSDSDDSSYSKYSYDPSNYSGSTIDLDDEDFDYEEASAELAGIDLETLEVADVQTKRFMRLMIAIFVRIMGGYIGRQLVNAWMKRDKNAFTRNMNLLVDKAMTYFPESEKASLEAEIAKKTKSGRSALLSSVMKALSGKLGDQAAKAWDDGDLDSLGDALGKAAAKIIDDAPFDDSKSGDDTDDNTDNSDASDTDATVDADAEPESEEEEAASTSEDDPSKIPSI